ncbi:hypothetical protein C8J57DRAFT_1235139 [Mycena rebaudengoi]|nr:hypothetical protein C8J57DRAFT_1235139 [Mycena rebaudengoi]
MTYELDSLASSLNLKHSATLCQLETQDVKREGPSASAYRRFCSIWCATLWDRLFGGTTLILHVDGTTVPNTPPLPEYLSCSMYLPPLFVADHPSHHAAIARIAQLFIESVGVPTVERWRRNANLRGWSLSQTGPVPRENSPGSILIPDPQPHSASYTVLGSYKPQTGKFTGGQRWPPLAAGGHCSIPIGSHR